MLRRIPVDIRTVARRVAKLFKKHGWKTRIKASGTTSSVYVHAQQGALFMQVRVSDHPPREGYEHLSVHPGGANKEDVLRAIGNMEKCVYESYVSGEKRDRRQWRV